MSQEREARPLWIPPPDARERTAMGRFFAQVAAASSRPADHAADRPADYAADGPADQPADQPAARAADRDDRPGPDAPYEAWHAWSCAHPEQFWAEVWKFCGVVATSRGEGVPPWAAVLERGGRIAPPGPEGPEWFRGARFNFAENLLRRRDHAPAIIARDERGRRRELSFTDVAIQAGACAAALSRDGVAIGDRVAGYLPNIPETVLAMLGAATVGATWTSCSPDFGVAGVLDRFAQVRPRVLICADGYHYAGKDVDCLTRVREIVEAVPSIERVVVVPFLGPAVSAEALAGIRGAVAWSEWVTPSAAPAFVRLPFGHPLYVMYSSGTTGLPKCMVHGAGGTLLQHLKEHQLHCDIGERDRVFYFTTCGWMMWNWLVSALASGATIVLYDGAPLPPGDPAALWRMAAEEHVTVFGTSARFLAACEKAGLEPARDHDLGALRMILSTGSPLAEHGFDYVMTRVRAGVHLASISGGTDLISCFALGNPLAPVWRGELQCAGLGMSVEVFDAAGRPVRGAPGELVCTRPFPSMPVAFWGDPDGSKYRDAYFSVFPGTWCHGDWVERTAHDGFIVHGRSDATLNPGGVRIGTAEVYRQVEQVPGIVESVVIGQDVPDGRGGTEVRVVLFVRLADGLTLDDALRERIRRRLREHASPHHVPRVIAQVNDIPHTINGKVTELAVRDVVQGRAVKNIEALANPGALAEYRDREDLQTLNP